MGLFSFLIKGRSVQSKPRSEGLIIGGVPLWANWTAQKEINHYLTAGDLYSIVKKISKTAKRVDLLEYSIKDQKAYAEYARKARKAPEDLSLVPHWMDDLHKLHKKALEPTGPQGKIQQLLDNPNYTQSKDEFYEGCYAFQLLTGNRYLWLDILEGGANQGAPAQMILLPPSYTVPVVVPGSFPREIKGYNFTLFKMMGYEPEEIIHSKYFNPNYDINGNELVGLSPLRAGWKTLEQSESEQSYAKSSFDNMGAYGAVNFEEVGLDDTAAVDTVGALKKKFYEETAGAVNARKVAFFAGKMAYTQFGVPASDMQLLESRKLTFAKLCNLYGISDTLFNNNSASTESNVKEMVKQMYLNAVLPEITSLRDALNSRLPESFKLKGRSVVEYDITEITELQESMNDKIKRFAEAPVFVPNDVRESMGYGRSDDPNMEKVYIKSGYQSLDDLNIATEPVTPTGDY